MAKASIDYMDARRAAQAASGGKTYSRATRQCPDRDLDIWEQTDQCLETAWANLRINSQAYWDKVFAQFGLQQGYSTEETF